MQNFEKALITAVKVTAFYKTFTINNYKKKRYATLL